MVFHKDAPYCHVYSTNDQEDLDDDTSRSKTFIYCKKPFQLSIDINSVEKNSDKP